MLALLPLKSVCLPSNIQTIYRFAVCFTFTIQLKDKTCHEVTYRIQLFQPLRSNISISMKWRCFCNTFNHVASHSIRFSCFEWTVIDLMGQTQHSATTVKYLPIHKLNFQSIYANPVNQFHMWCFTLYTASILLATKSNLINTLCISPLT